MKGKYAIFVNDNNQVRMYLIPEHQKHKTVETPQDPNKPFRLIGAAEFRIEVREDRELQVVAFGESFGYGTKANQEDARQLAAYFGIKHYTVEARNGFF